MYIQAAICQIIKFKTIESQVTDMLLLHLFPLVSHNLIGCTRLQLVEMVVLQIIQRIDYVKLLDGQNGLIVIPHIMYEWFTNSKHNCLGVPTMIKDACFSKWRLSITLISNGLGRILITLIKPICKWQSYFWKIQSKQLYVVSFLIYMLYMELYCLETSRMQFTLCTLYVNH